MAAAAGAEADEVALDVSAVDESKQDPKQSGITVDISSIQVGQMLKGTVVCTIEMPQVIRTHKSITVILDLRIPFLPSI